MAKGLVLALTIVPWVFVGAGAAGLVASFLGRSRQARGLRSLSWLGIVLGGTAWFMQWKARAAEQVSMDVLYVLYKALGVGVLALLVGLALLNWSDFVRGSIRVWVIVRKELFGYFASPLGYIIILDYIAIIGFLFYFFMQFRGASVNLFPATNFTFWMFFVSMLTVPMITMRLFAEEKSTGTMEMLVTSPISEVQIVVGKYLAALVFYAATLAPTIVYVFLLREYSPGAPEGPAWYKVHLWIGHLFRHQDQPELGIIITSYLGVFLMGAIFIAIGALVSAMTRHQVVAGMITLHALLVLWLILKAATWEKWEVPDDSWKMKVYNFLQYAHFEGHLEPFQKGLVDSRGLVYAATSIVFLLFLTVKTLEVRRWK